MEDRGILFCEVGYDIEVEETSNLSLAVCRTRDFLGPLDHGPDLSHYAPVAECYQYSFRGVFLVLSVCWLPQPLCPRRSRQTVSEMVMAYW